MAERTFAPWVQPVAEATSQAAADLLEVARSVPEQAWQRPSPVPGWSYHDLFAHLVGGSGGMFRYVLASVVEGRRIDPERVAASTDELNAGDVNERRGRSAAELIAEFEATTEERLDLLARLTEAHRDVRQAEFPITFGEFLTNDPGGHVREHLAQLRTALERKGTP
jgi:uncharacterized protein (TIGR03083 family)